MTSLLLAAAFLCGTPIGFIFGMIAAWRLLRPALRGEPDYSAGL